MDKFVILKKNEERRILSGHQWIFSNEIFEINGDPQNGEIVSIIDSRHNLLGSGFYNKNSLIAVRHLSPESAPDFRKLLSRRFADAHYLRKSLYPERNSYRFLFSESDFVPGLIIDKYNSTFVLQVYSAGIEKNIDVVVDLLKSDYAAENIFTKNEEYFRMLEGLPAVDHIYMGDKTEEVISDGSVSYRINFEQGHKTGFYFDQNDNRFFIEKLSKGKTVLDAFCNSGGFGLHAAKAGAVKIAFVDSSQRELENVKHNFQLNELSADVEFTVSDVFDHFQKLISENKTYDIVIIDPPAFAKNKKSLPAAKKGYEKLNRLAMNLINPGGYLVTSSCSHHVQPAEFIDIVRSAASKNSSAIQQIHFNEASLDHPKLPAMPETSYLKFAVFRVMN